MKAAAKAGGEGAADQIARLLREGRAAEVTDEMLGALGPNDQARLFDLYESGATGMDLPMDEASRMARAGNTVDALHGGPGSFEWDASGRRGAIQRFEPGREGASFFTDDPGLATGYANRGQEPRPAIYPVKLDNSSFITLDASVKPLRNKEIFDEISNADASGAVVTNAEDFTPGYHAPPSTVVIAKDPANIRSRHARFDPRLSKNADLLASRAAPGGMGDYSTQEARATPRGVMAIPMRPSSPSMPSGAGPSLSDALSRVAQAFGTAGRAGIEGMATALSGVDEQGRSVGSILPFAKDERTGEVGLASPRILDLWNTAGGAVPAKGITLGAGPILGGRGHIARTGPRSSSAYVDGAYAGEVNVSPGGPFISSVTVEPGLRGQGIGRELYKEAEELAAAQLVPSPLGLSDDAVRVWQRRLASMAPDEANALIGQSREIGRRYGISDAHLDERLGPLLRSADDAPGSLGIGGERRLTYRDVEDWL